MTNSFVWEGFTRFNDVTNHCCCAKYVFKTFKWEVVISNTSKETETKLDTTGVIVYRGSRTGIM